MEGEDIMSQGRKILVYDEWLVDYFKENLLVYIPKDRKEKIKKALDKFIASKYNAKKEIEATLNFYVESGLFFLQRIFTNLDIKEKIILRDIKKLLLVLKKLQDILFQLPNYRDHLPHQLRVYLLGSYLLHEEFPIFKKIFTEKFIRTICKNVNEKIPEDYQILEDPFSYLLVWHPPNFEIIFFDAWATAALLHDLGYAIQGLSRLAASVSKLYENFIKTLKIKIDIEIRPKNELSMRINSFEKCVASLYGEYLKKVLAVLKDENDHGIWSAFFTTSKELFEKLAEATEKMLMRIKELTIWDYISGFYFLYRENLKMAETPLEKEFDLSYLYALHLYIDSLVAMALHNKPFFILISPILSILVISDTLQEWCRFDIIDYKIRYFPRTVYLRTYSKEAKIIESEIYIYDFPPEKFYKILCEDWNIESNKNKNISSIISKEKLQDEYLDDIVFIISLQKRPDLTMKVSKHEIKF